MSKHVMKSAVRKRLSTPSKLEAKHSIFQDREYRHHLDLIGQGRHKIRGRRARLGP